MSNDLSTLVIPAKPRKTFTMKKLFALLCIVLALPTLARAADNETAFDRILRTGTLRCGYTSSAPYLVIDANTGALSGIQYDIVNEIGKRMDVKVEWTTEAAFGTAVADLQVGKYDMFCVGLTPTGVRGKFVDFTTAPFLSPFDIWVRADDHRFDTSPASLNAKGVTMAAIEGTLIAMIHTQNFPKSTAVGVVSMGDENIDLLLSVATGKADFTVAERTIGENFVAKNPGTLRRLVDRPIWTVPFAFPVLKGETRLQQSVNTTLLEMQATGALDAILDAHKTEAPNLLRLPPLYAVSQ